MLDGLLDLVGSRDMDAQVLDLQVKVNTGTSWTRNEQFDKDGYLIIKNIWDPAQLYHPVPPVKGLLNFFDKDPTHFEHELIEQQVEGSCSRYWHPMYRTIHTDIRLKLEKVLGRKLYNTYYYDRYYFPGQVLDKHADRDACEISVTVHIGTNLPDELKDWPIKIETPSTYDDTYEKVLVEGEERSCVLNPGDGMVYKGCERPHWRDPMPSPQPRKRDWFLKKIGRYEEVEYYYHQIFFHYVLADGVRSHCAYDCSR